MQHHNIAYYMKEWQRLLEEYLQVHDKWIIEDDEYEQIQWMHKWYKSYEQLLIQEFFNFIFSENSHT